MRVLRSNDDILKVESEAADAETSAAEPATIDGQLIRIANPATSITADGTPYTREEPEEDPVNPKKLNTENIIQKDGLEVYKVQAGRLWTGLATYWIK
jgi:pre-mRNA-splicing factor SYF1